VQSVSQQESTVSELIDQYPLGRFQIWTIVLCGLVLVLDGFDAQVAGYLVPSISKSTHIPIHSFGPILSASLFGLMIAAMTTGPIADRWGRRWPVILSTLSFAGFSLLTARATSFNELLAFRFLTGIGLGGAMPNVVAIAAEYVPKRLLSIVVTLLFCGMPFGGVICGLLSSAVITTWGWRWAFYIGGMFPLAIAVLLIVRLPESVQFLALQGRDVKSIRRLLGRIAPSLSLSDFTLRASSERTNNKGVPLKRLFTEGRAWGTVLLWIPNFMNLLMIYFIHSWLPALLTEAGLSASAGAMATAFFSFGGIVGCLAEGPLIQNLGAYGTLSVEFTFSAVLVAGLAFVTRFFPLVVMATFLLGLMVTGAQSGLNALAASFYPTSVRSTGVGWALGVGRIGSIVGPLVAGALLSMAWQPRQILIAGSAVGICAWISILIGRYMSNSATAYGSQPGPGRS